jgi:hypothetical protein
VPTASASASASSWVIPTQIRKINKTEDIALNHKQQGTDQNRGRIWRILRRLGGRRRRVGGHGDLLQGGCSSGRRRRSKIELKKEAVRGRADVGSGRRRSAPAVIGRGGEITGWKWTPELESASGNGMGKRTIMRAFSQWAGLVLLFTGSPKAHQCRSKFLSKQKSSRSWACFGKIIEE